MQPSDGLCDVWLIGWLMRLAGSPAAESGGRPKLRRGSLVNMNVHVVLTIAQRTREIPAVPQGCQWVSRELSAAIRRPRQTSR